MTRIVGTGGIEKVAACAIALGMASGGCGSNDPSGPPSADSVGQATLAITNVPADVRCLQVTVIGSRTDVRKFDVVPQQSTVLTMSGLPVGAVSFVENAFAETCSATTSASVPTWLSDSTSATLIAGTIAQVTIVLRRNGQAVVTSDFQEDPSTPADAGPPCVPRSFEVACADRECGTVSNGCVGHYSCGSCGGDICEPTTCRSGLCVPISACLVAGTPISLADGTERPIERVEVGDEVLAYDVATGTPRPQRVTQTFKHRAEENLAGIVLVNGTLRSTGNHPVYANGRWVRADQLGVGDALIELQHKSPRAGSTVHTVEMLSGEEETYNLEVGGDHNYFADGILVHNKPPPCF